MNSSTRLLLVAPLALATLAVPAFLSPSSASAAATPARTGESPLEEHMQALQAAAKGLDKALEKGEVEKALGLVVDMQKAAQEAKSGTPEKAAEIADAKEKAAFLSGYRLKLIELQHGLLDVEAALVAGKVDEAKKALDAKVKPTKKAGHDAYKG